MSVKTPSILDRVKAKIQVVFARHQPSDVPAESDMSHTTPATPETATPTGAEDVGSRLSLP